MGRQVGGRLSECRKGDEEAHLERYRNRHGGLAGNYSRGGFRELQVRSSSLLGFTWHHLSSSVICGSVVQRMVALALALALHRSMAFFSGRR